MLSESSITIASATEPPLWRAMDSREQRTRGVAPSRASATIIAARTPNSARSSSRLRCRATGSTAGTR